MNGRSSKFATLVLILAPLPLAIGCVIPPPPPDALICPDPILGNSGEYMCPYTQDEVLAEWVDDAVKAKMASSVGGAVGAYAGRKLLEQVPLIGGLIGEKVGSEVARKIAIKAAGGMEHIKKTSDLSFNQLDDMAVFLYAAYSSNEHYQSALDATWEIYPDLKRRYWSAIHAAPRKPGYVSK